MQWLIGLHYPARFPTVQAVEAAGFPEACDQTHNSIIPGHYEICVAGTLPLDQALNFEVDVHDDCIDAQPEDILTVRFFDQKLGRLPSGEPGPCWLRSQTVEVIAMKFGIVNS